MLSPCCKAEATAGPKCMTQKKVRIKTRILQLRLGIHRNNQENSGANRTSAAKQREHNVNANIDTYTDADMDVAADMDTDRPGTEETRGFKYTGLMRKQDAGGQGTTRHTRQ